MIKSWLMVSVAALAGCSYQLNLQQRGGPASGSGTAHDSNSAVEIRLGHRLYRGQYVFASGDSVGTVTGTARHGKSYTTTSSVSGVGRGSILARSGDGHGLRCQFEYSTANEEGFGECQDDSGTVYDLQIRMGGS